MSTADEHLDTPIALPTARLLHEQIVGARNDLAALKTVVATRDDLASLGLRLDGIEGKVDQILGHLGIADRFGISP